MIITRPMLLLAPDQGGGGGGTSPADGGTAGKTTPGADGAPGGKAQQDTAGAGTKTTEPALPTDPVQLQALLKAEREEKAHLLSVHTEMKTKAEQREAADAKTREENLKKQGEYQKLLEEQTPKFEAAAATIKRYEGALNRYLESELKAIPENLKALMPDGDPASKLEWIAKAKEAGAVSKPQGPAKKPGDGSPPPGGASATTATRAAFDAMTPKEKVDFSKAGGKLTE